MNSHPFASLYFFVSVTDRAVHRSCHMQIIPLLLALAVALPLLAGEPPNINYDESKVGPVVLPDLLQTAHGETITTARHFGVAADAPAATLPISVSGDGRQPDRQGGSPFFLHGDTAWSLLVMLDQEETERYLEDPRQRGLDALIVNLLEHKFATNPPKNRHGDGPFLTPGISPRPTRPISAMLTG